MSNESIALTERDRQAALALLKQLVATETTDYHEGNGQPIVEAFLQGMGFETRYIIPDARQLAKYPAFNQGHDYGADRYCVVGCRSGERGGKSILLNAHMDTVFPASPEEWKTDPFTPTEQDGRLYGLGAADTKGGMAAMLSALKLLHDRDQMPGGDIIFESVVDEEAGGGNGSLACIDAGYKADGVLVAEPNCLRPTSAHIGSYALKLTVEGKSAHGNMKWQGVSALEKALPLMNRLKALEEKWSQRTFDLLPSPVLTILQAEAGDGSITIPGECRLLVNYTYLPDGYDYLGELMEVIGQCQQEDEWLREHPIQVEKHHDCGPYYTNPAEPWPTLIADIASEILGEPVQIGGLPCGADARLFASIGQMPTVVLGPGSIDVAHKPNEYLPLEQFYTAIELYANIIKRWGETA